MGTVLAIAFCMLLGAWTLQSIRNEFLASKVKEMLRRADAIFTIMEGQNKARDAVVDRVVDEVRDVKRDTQRAATVAAQARDVAAAAIEKVPEKVVQALKGSDSGAEWKPGDQDRRSPGGG